MYKNKFLQEHNSNHEKKKFRNEIGNIKIEKNISENNKSKIKNKNIREYKYKTT